MRGKGVCRLNHLVSKRLTPDQVEEIRSRLGQRAADAPFTAVEAAIYTGRSTRTLKRAIDAGIGPRREKNPDATGLGATNRHTRYRKADLDQWRERLVSFATDFHQFDDLALDAPWLVDGEVILGHLMDLEDIETALETLSADAVIFLRLDEALQRTWASADRRRHFQVAFEAICQKTICAADAAAQRDAMEETTGPALGGSRGPLRP